jgi:hypothetical protein
MFINWDFEKIIFCGELRWVGIQLPEIYKQNFDVLSKGPL